LHSRIKKILVLCPSPKGTAATQRFKYEQYFGMLETEGYSFTISSFQSKRFWRIIYKPGRVLEKIAWTAVGYLKRCYDLLRAPFYDAVFVNLWVTPLGVPFFERILCLFNNRVIYDIDDMIMVKFDHVKENVFQKLKGKRKPITLMKHASYVIACTPQLKEMAKALNKYKRVIDISSTINTERFQPVNCYKKSKPIVIGWTGTHSAFPFLESLQPVLKEVSLERDIKLMVIANKKFFMEDVLTEFLYWNEETEVADLHKMDIGLYPIPANEYSLGKSSLKALTYMSVGVPVVATAYGTNFRVIENGVEGFLAKDNAEWVKRIIELVDDVDLRRSMGSAGRKTVEEHFSIKVNFDKYLQVFKTVIPNHE
jgi:glycosyltransferase involved in cell wall biosynthesis